MIKFKSFSYFLPIALFFSVLAISCSKQEQNEATAVEESATPLFRSIEDIKALELDVKFNLPSDIYREFLESVVFKDQQLRGFYFGDIVKDMNHQEHEQFWASFGINIQLGADLDYDDVAISRNELLPRLGEFCTLLHYSPLYCRPSRGSICMSLC